jgi:hypothetical protein
VGDALPGVAAKPPGLPTYSGLHFYERDWSEHELHDHASHRVPSRYGDEVESSVKAVARRLGRNAAFIVRRMIALGNDTGIHVVGSRPRGSYVAVVAASCGMQEI